LPAVLQCPQPLLAEARSPVQQAIVCAGDRSLIEHPSGLVDGSAVNDCLCTSTPITIIRTASSNAGGDRRADRPQSRQQPRSYQVTLDGLGKAAATQRWQVNLRGDMRE